MTFPIEFLWLFIAAMVISSIGFKNYVWFISLGYGFSIAGEGILMLILYGKTLTVHCLRSAAGRLPCHPRTGQQLLQEEYEGRNQGRQDRSLRCKDCHLGHLRAAVRHSGLRCVLPLVQCSRHKRYHLCGCRYHGTGPDSGECCRPAEECCQESEPQAFCGHRFVPSGALPQLSGRNDLLDRRAGYRFWRRQPLGSVGCYCCGLYRHHLRYVQRRPPSGNPSG